MNKCGAVITWEYFFGDQELPKVLKLVQDRDLWIKKYSETDDFFTYICEQDNTFESFDKFLNEEELNEAISLEAI